MLSVLHSGGPIHPLAVGIRAVGLIAGLNRDGPDGLSRNACALALAKDVTNVALKRALDAVLIPTADEAPAVSDEPSRIGQTVVYPLVDASLTVPSQPREPSMTSPLLDVNLTEANRHPMGEELEEEIRAQWRHRLRQQGTLDAEQQEKPPRVKVRTGDARGVLEVDWRFELVANVPATALPITPPRSGAVGVHVAGLQTFPEAPRAVAALTAAIIFTHVAGGRLSVATVRPSAMSR